MRPALSSRYTSTLGFTPINWPNNVRTASGRNPFASINGALPAMLVARSRDSACTTSFSRMSFARICSHADAPEHASSRIENTSDSRRVSVSFIMRPADPARRACSRAPTR